MRKLDNLSRSDPSCGVERWVSMIRYAHRHLIAWESCFNVARFYRRDAGRDLSMSANENEPTSTHESPESVQDASANEPTPKSARLKSLTEPLIRQRKRCFEPRNDRAAASIGPIEYSASTKSHELSSPRHRTRHGGSYGVRDAGDARVEPSPSLKPRVGGQDLNPTLSLRKRQLSASPPDQGGITHS